MTVHTNIRINDVCKLDKAWNVPK